MSLLTPAKRQAMEAWFAENFVERGDVGASVSVWEHGQEVLSLAAGSRDRAGTEPWTAETLVPVWSATKGPAAVCCLLALHEAGIDLRRPVVDVWPEFGAGGKERITLTQLLSHTAGLSALDEKVSILDYAAVIEALENQRPAWEPGTRQGYHARTFGFLVEELVRRVSGAGTLGQYFQDRFGAPLDLSFWIGLPEEQWGRVSPLYTGRVRPGVNDEPFMKAFNTPGSLVRQTFTSPLGLNAVSDFNQPSTWAQGFASMGGVGSAQGLAKFYAMLAQGGTWDGCEMVPAIVVRQLSQTLSQQEDAVLCTPVAFAAGVMKDPVEQARKLRHHFGASHSAFGHPGAGGSLAFADPENGIAFTYVMNQMELGALPNAKSLGLVERLYAQE